MSYDSENRTKIDAPVLRSAYGEKIQISLVFAENSPHTRQEFKEEADINTIMGRYMRTGELPQLNLIAPQYLELDGATFQEHMEFIAEAKSMFNELPSYIRNRFDNDPGKFIEFTSNENNRQELAQMGLLSTDATKAILTPRVDAVAPATAPVGASPEPSQIST